MKMGITPEQFEIFGQTFISTLEEESEISRKALDAWQAVMWPAIEHLKRATTRPSGNDEGNAEK